MGQSQKISPLKSKNLRKSGESKHVRRAQNIFSPVASRILRVLLIHSDKGWSIKDLSKEANVSLGYAHAVIMSLIERGHVYRDGLYRIRVTDPVRLVQGWGAYHSYVSVNTFLRYHTLEKEIDAFLSKMQEIDESEYALTALAGAYLVVPYVRPTTIHFYIRQRETVKSLVKSLDLHPVETGGNVSFVLPYDNGVFYGTSNINGLSVVNKVQLYVDLFNYPARGEEAAEAILRVLTEQWAHQRNM